MRLAIDVSTYLETLEANVKYFDDGKEIDPLKEFARNGVDLFRLRVWNDPFSHNDRSPYLGGTNDIEQDIKIINLSKGYGYQYIIDFHYSDFWVDPGKQTLPKAWKNLSYEEIKQEVYLFTRDSLLRIKNETGAEVSYVQIGNEITNGLLWPYGQIAKNGSNEPRHNFDHFIELIKSGIKGAKEVYPNTKIIIHLEKSGDHDPYNDIFSRLEKANVNYDIIGMSYYPYWHGSFDEVFANIRECKRKFHKKVMIMETSYSFTLDDYLKTESGKSELSVRPETITMPLEYEPTPEGQAAYIEELIARAKKEDIEGICYWEPLWLPASSLSWASKDAQAYINELKPITRNEWCNQCLFDYKGNKLPAFDKYKI